MPVDQSGKYQMPDDYDDAVVRGAFIDLATRFYPWPNVKSTPSFADIADELTSLRAEVASLSAITLQLQAMIYEMWSGERSEVIIVPPSAAHVRADGVLRLDGE